ncbi:chorismate mutase [Thioclava sp. GXIMD4216]|uniref:chorismate mutase n=1 Tax=Thioclava litoralis TaxID=3076557 RepID=A0ABZ1E279_9RHOB|nr:chorismate mutase [Thioclava sp. FTW29]
MKDPKTIPSMKELREQIDWLDRQIVEHLAYRLTLIDRAIDLKPEEDMPARIEERVEDVVAKVKAHAAQCNGDVELFEQLYRIMIEASIQREERVLGTGDFE